MQFYREELEWALVTLTRRPGGFLGKFIEAALAADIVNYEILRPFVLKMIEKYPL